MSTATWVLLHGTPLTAPVWDRVAQTLRRGGADTWQPDMAPEPVSTKVIPDLARRLVDTLPATGLVHLVGHSFGGQVALETALLAEDRVATLTMLCARDTPYPRFHTLAEALRRGEPVDVDGALERWFRPDELATADPLIAYARRCVTNADPRSWAQCLDAIADFDRVSQTMALNLPVHLVAAEHDEVSTVQAMTDMVSRLPHAQLTVLPGRGHMSAFLRPDLLAGLLISGVSAH